MEYFWGSFKKDSTEREVNIDKCDGREVVVRDKLFRWFGSEIDRYWTAISKHKGCLDCGADEILRWVEVAKFQWECLLWRIMPESNKPNDRKGDKTQEWLGVDIVGWQEVWGD